MVTRIKNQVKSASNLSVVFWIIFFVLAYKLIRDLSLFQINDDFFLYGVSSGKIYGTPSSDLVYITSPLNLILEFLYTNFQQINWYYESYLINLLAALVAIVFITQKNFELKNMTQNLIYIFIILFPFFILTKMFFYIQFSQIAIISAGIGTLLFFKSNTKLIKFNGIIFIILGFSWRSEAAIISVSLVVLMLLISALIGKQTEKIKGRSTLSFVFLVLIIFSIKSVAFLGTAPWQSELKNNFQKKRFDINRTYDYLPTKAAREKQNEVALEMGWSQNDFNLFTRYYFADEEIYSVELLNKLASESRLENNFEFYAESIISFGKLILNQYLLINIGVVLFIFLTFILNKKFGLLRFFICIMLFHAFLYGIYLLGKLPERIHWPISFIFLISMIVLFFDSKYFRRFNFKTLLILVLPIILFSINLFRQDYQSIIENQWWKKVREERVLGFDRVLAYKPDKPIIAFSSFYSPLITTLDLKSNNPDDIFSSMIYINWLVGSEEYNNHLKSLGIEKNLFISIAKQEAYLATSRIEELQMVNQYLIEHHDIEPIWDIAPFVFSDTGLGIWKIIGIK